MRRSLLTIVAIALVASACAEQAPQPTVSLRPDGAPVLALGAVTLEKEVDEVVVIATFDPAAPTVLDVAFDTHSVDLGFDVDTFSKLTIDGTSTPIGGWDGTEPGGHHRWGMLGFAVEPGPGQVVEYTFTGLSEPLTFSWRMPDGSDDQGTASR